MNDRLREFYEEKALSYPEQDRPAMARCERAVGLAQLQDGQRVLDIACKDAVLLGEIERAGRQVDYVGVDISERVIANCKARGFRGTFLVEDILAGSTLPAHSFDRIFALEIMEHLPTPSKLLDEVRRLLKPDGRFVLSVPNPFYYMEVINELRHYPDTDGHFFSFTDANMRALLQHAGYQVEDTCGTYFLIPRRLRGAFANQDVWVLKRPPELLARSRVYRCRPV